MKVSVSFNPAFAGLDVWLYEDKADGRYVVEPMDFVVRKLDDRGAEYITPTFRFNEHSGTEFLNSFVNALVVAGFKPDEIKAHDKEVAAIKYHLEDMRRLAIKEG